ncbi:Heparan-sulfate 6-O-sulfotransferase [Caligus rogercresseyi]|uniref:Heparan-sulfate 6-O-sulfotransferase n=1 Tax=Caligus rogercresseyi TaxID=217165 RepID=A0A7T8JY04_CALRO|nr:Heparan-sulfate 6-O-sulfotransferase [Caligus rogercresseyi]
MRAASLEEDESEMLLLSEGLLKRGRGLRWPNRRLLFAAILTSGFLGFLCLWSREEESSFSSHPVVISSEPGTQNFSFNGSDVMIFLHIQKTGGTTFGKHLVQDINLESPCSCIKRGSKKKKRKKKKKKTPLRVLSSRRG